MVLSFPSHAARLQFVPCSYSWVALHPQPKGVIQLVGTGLLGKFPTITYRHFLKSLFSAGYTVVAFPFRSTLHHWSTAIDLLDEHYGLRVSLVELAMAKGYDPSIYLDAASYTWIGHGLGCKYVMLLELLSASPEEVAPYFHQVGPDNQQLQEIEQGLSFLGNRIRLVEKRIQQLTGRYVDYGQPSIEHQSSLLLAPALSDSILVKLLQLVPNQRLAISPTVEQTHQLVEHSRLFHLAGLIQFARDRKTANTCQRLMQEQPHLRRRLLKGSHLEPVGIQLGQLVVDFNPLDKFIQPLSCRDLEFQSLVLLHRLRKTPASSRQTKCAAPARRRLAA